MTARSGWAEHNAVAALDLLMLDRVITRFTTNFDDRRQPWIRPKVMVSIGSRDELTLARIRRRVLAAVSPHLKDVLVTVTGERAPRTPRLGDDESPPRPQADRQ